MKFPRTAVVFTLAAGGDALLSALRNYDYDCDEEMICSYATEGWSSFGTCLVPNPGPVLVDPSTRLYVEYEDLEKREVTASMGFALSIFGASVIYACVQFG